MEKLKSYRPFGRTVFYIVAMSAVPIQICTFELSTFLVAVRS